MAASALLAQLVYDVTANVIIDSAVRAITGWDIMTSIMKSWVFGVIIAVVRTCLLAPAVPLRASHCKQPSCSPVSACPWVSACSNCITVPLPP